MTYPSPRSLGGGAAAYHERAGRVPNPQGPPPPLPNGIPFRAPDYRARGAADADADSSLTPLRVLRGGCYLARYTPLQVSPTQPGAIHYLGTVRVQQVGVTVTVSGDLYLRRVPTAGQPQSPEPDPGDGVPVFPRSEYRYYLRATNVTPASSLQSFVLGLELFRFSNATMTWANEGQNSAELSWTTSPPGYPSDADYLTGDMKNDTGTVIGTLTLGWVSPFLRAAALEIDKVATGVIPRDNGNGIGFKEVFEPLGWDFRIVVSDGAVPEASGPSWSDAEMHDAMLKWRDRRATLLDLEWRYHLLCVALIDETERGIMYDQGATDSNQTPREGVGIACDWVYPSDPVWGELQGKRFGDDAATYFRTAIHELGHALGLYHNGADNGFMNTTDVIARRANPQRPFPQNIRWTFNPDDEKRLRHMPDIWVRPGGIQFGEDYSVAPIAADDTITTPEGLQLVVQSVQSVIPLGAPARVDFRVKNVSDVAVRAPQNLSLRGGSARGTVIDPSGTVRTFQPLVQCVESQPLVALAAGAEVENSATLLRGPQGALFPATGLYKIIVELRWDDAGTRYGLLGSTDLVVHGAEDVHAARAAYDVLSNPDTLVALAANAPAGEGASAIKQAAADPVLGPHYVWLDAKRACRSKDPTLTLEALTALRSPSAVLSNAERKKADAWLGQLASDAAKKEMRDTGGTPAQAREFNALVKHVRKGLTRNVDEAPG